MTSLDVDLQCTKGSHLCDLDYADDTLLLDTSHERMQVMTEAAENADKKIGLYINVEKCKTSSQIIRGWYRY